MAAKATITIKGLDKALKGLDQYSDETTLAVGRTIERYTFLIADDARQFVPKDTSALARSITPETNIRFGFAKEDQTLEGRVFTNLPYAAVVEFGFSGTQQVRQHTRNITQVFGRKLRSPVSAVVSAHPRRVNRRGAYYMTRAAEKNEKPLLDSIKQAMKLKK